MTDLERERAAMLLGGLAETLGQQLTVARIGGMLEALDDVPFEHLVPAIRKASRTCKFVPSPAELRDLADEAARAPRPLMALPPLEHEEERERIAASWQGREEEARAMLAALPRTSTGRAVASTLDAAIENRMREMQEGSR